MCNLYSVTKGQTAILEFTRAMIDEAGNLPSLPAIFPDQMAPVVRETAAGRALVRMRWGFPKPPTAPGAGLVTNIRNTASSYWLPWLQPAFRCLVPATSFCEYTASLPKVPTWFALSDDRPLFAFAAIWRPWAGTRGTKADPAIGDHQLFGFLTTDANALVRPIHKKAMPVIVRTQAECDTWLTAPVNEALAMQRPLPDDALRIVARGQKQDGLADEIGLGPGLLL